MRYAVVNDHRQEAQRGLSGKCPNCDQPMVAKCGEKRIWHWAHIGRRTCDPWWENETEWHRAWKGKFPVHWQEVVHRAENGEKHIADVKTNRGWVLEFQHSYLNPEERRAREAFYPRLIWVVDGVRRKRDRLQFLNALKGGVLVSTKPPMLRVISDECVLLQEWGLTCAPTFFDFGEVDMPQKEVLWCLVPASTNSGGVYVVPFLRAGVINLHRAGPIQTGPDFGEHIKKLINIVSADVSRRRNQRQRDLVRYQTQMLTQLARQSRGRRLRQRESYQQYLARKLRARSRRRF